MAITIEMWPPAIISRCARLSRPSPVTPQTWLQCLDLWTGGDKELQRYLRQMAGYCLSGSTREHALLWLHGSGTNGKSTFVNTIRRISGSYAMTLPMESLLRGREQSVPADIASLAGKRLAVVGELGAGAWAVERIKQLTGGDEVAARFMRQNYFTFTPKAKLLIAGNERPSLSTVDPAIKRRLHLVPFVARISNPDQDLETTLQTEWGRILTWMIRGATEWLEAGQLTRCGAVERYSDAYLDDQDVVGQWLQERCEVGPNKSELSSVLYADYKRWCERNGYRPKSARSLGHKLSDLRFGTDRTKHARVRTGLCLRAREHSQSNTY